MLSVMVGTLPISVARQRSSPFFLRWSASDSHSAAWFLILPFHDLCPRSRKLGAERPSRWLGARLRRADKPRTRRQIVCLGVLHMIEHRFIPRLANEVQNRLHRRAWDLRQILQTDFKNRIQKRFDVGILNPANSPLINGLRPKRHLSKRLHRRPGCRTIKITRASGKSEKSAPSSGCPADFVAKATLSALRGLRFENFGIGHRASSSTKLRRQRREHITPGSSRIHANENVVK